MEEDQTVYQKNMKGHKVKVRSSTILEVVVSMVIIVVVFGIAMMIFTNVQRSSLSVKKLRAQALLREAANTADATKTITADEFRIEQEVKPYRADSALTDVHLTAYDQNRQKVAELEKVTLTRP
jgi:Tfp pilus assembly protein PilV